MNQVRKPVDRLLEQFISDAQSMADEQFPHSYYRSYNRWLESSDDILRVYVRRSVRIWQTIMNGGEVTLDLASISAEPQGTGRFTEFLNFAESLKPFDGIFVESVLNPRLADFLHRRGYTEIPNLEPSSFLFLWERKN